MIASTSIVSLMAIIYFGFGLRSQPQEIEREIGSDNTNIFEASSACAKQHYLWERIQQSKHQTLPKFENMGLGQLTAMGMQRLSLKATLDSDFAPQGWVKYLHRRGSMAKVKIVSTSDRYTGVFKGAECALLRLSLTYNPVGNKAVAPGLALKVLRDGYRSANISALVAMDGQGKDFDFFSRPMSNILPPGSGFGTKLVHNLFSRVSKWPEELLAGDMARVDTHGASEGRPVGPRQLFFVPNPDLGFSSSEHDVRDDFAKIRRGTVIYQIKALPERGFDYLNFTEADAAALLRDAEHVADIVTTSEFIASQFGDEGIFFRHELRMNRN
jgi:hypothetical protein